MAGYEFDPGKARTKVWEWENAESHLRHDRFGKERALSLAIRKWEEAEMAILGWQEKANAESFRRGYLEWLAKGAKVADSVGMTELDIEQLPMLERIVARGYRELSKKAHPDVGGSAEEFDQVTQAKKQLEALIASVRDLL